MNVSYHSLKTVLSRNTRNTLNSQAELGACNVCGCICCHKVFPQRYCMTLILVLGLSIAYMQRVCINLAIVDMTIAPQMLKSNRTNAICPSTEKKSNNKSESSNLQDQKFDWDETVQSYILLSFYLGYLVGNIPAGFFTDSWGARWFLLGGCCLSSVTTGIIPPLADYCHWSTIVAARVFAGIGQSTIFPGASSLISRWIPEDKQTSVTSIVMTSFTIGTILGNVFTGYIIKWTQTWCWVYYIYAIVGSTWVVLFYFYVFSDPYHHPHVSSQELADLAALAQITKKPHQRLPIRRILSDLAVWSMIIAQFGNDYTLFTIITNMPKYFTTVLNINTQTTGILLMAPPLACFCGSILFGFTADGIIKKGCMKKVHFRILVTVLALPLSNVFMIFMTYMKCDLIAANILLCLTMLMKSSYFAGVGMMSLDMSRNYSGLLLGFCNASGSLAGMIAPYTIGVLAYDNTFPQWMTIQYVSTGISVVTLIPYLMFARGNRKDWDYGPNEEKPDGPDDKTGGCKTVWSCYKPE